MNTQGNQATFLSHAFPNLRCLIEGKQLGAIPKMLLCPVSLYCEIINVFGMFSCWILSQSTVSVTMTPLNRGVLGNENYYQRLYKYSSLN